MEQYPFCARLNIMDYSLLVGVHDLDRVDEDEADELGEEDEEEYESGGSGILSVDLDHVDLMTMTQTTRLRF